MNTLFNLFWILAYFLLCNVWLFASFISRVVRSADDGEKRWNGIRSTSSTHRNMCVSLTLWKCWRQLKNSVVASENLATLMKSWQRVQSITTEKASVFCSAEVLPAQSKVQSSAETAGTSWRRSHIKHPSKSTRGTNPGNTLRHFTVYKRLSNYQENTQRSSRGEKLSIGQIVAQLQ